MSGFMHRLKKVLIYVLTLDRLCNSILTKNSLANSCSHLRVWPFFEDMKPDIKEITHFQIIAII